MGVEQVPVEAAVHEWCRRSPVCTLSTRLTLPVALVSVWPIADQEFAQLEGVGGLHRRAVDDGLQRIGAVIAQLRLHRRRQEGIVLVEQVGLAGARLDFLREVPAEAVGFRALALDIEGDVVGQVIAEAAEQRALVIAVEHLAIGAVGAVAARVQIAGAGGRIAVGICGAGDAGIEGR